MVVGKFVETLVGSCRLECPQKLATFRFIGAMLKNAGVGERRRYLHTLDCQGI